MRQSAKSSTQTITVRRPFPALRKNTSAISSRMPEKMRKVTAVPTAGIVTKVGRKVPRMLPTVLQAPRRPTVRPLSSRLPTVAFTSEGVTVPSRKSGKTKISMQEAKAAMMRKFVLTVKISRPETPRMMYFPTTGIAAIHTAAIRMRR